MHFDYSFMERRIFVILSGSLLICCWFSATVIAYCKQLISLFFGFIVAFLLFVHSGESMYDPPRLRLILLRKVIHS